MRENAENTGREKPPAWQTVLIWVFFPIGLLKLWYDYVSRRLRMDISQKTTMVNTAVFFLLLACYAVFVIVNAATWDGFYAMVRLVCVSVVALPLFTVYLRPVVASSLWNSSCTQAVPEAEPV